MIELDTSQLDSTRTALAAFNDNKAKRVMSNALNRAMESMNTVAKRGIAKKYNIKAGTVGRAMTKSKASPNRLVAKVKSEGRAISIIQFGAKDTKKKGVRVTIIRGRRKVLRNSFFLGSKGSFHRVGRKRLPIKKEYGPSIPSMLKNAEVSEEAVNKGTEVYQRRLEHEIRRALFDL